MKDNEKYRETRPEETNHKPRGTQDEVWNEISVLKEF
jgi:hypothetical protein